ncbi:hypothetical protein T4D_13851 [Trichinella pseudospiralis]|uniref:Uncharacterized protein n=1 Tax=Trichinella pseudospiralis TaxID=6337 RepID=A0A0V1FAI7_TRIPS|nr:hypothetical protein T4D_13851 [Trichinella pseudospiralis]
MQSLASSVDGKTGPTICHSYDCLSRCFSIFMLLRSHSMRNQTYSLLTEEKSKMLINNTTRGLRDDHQSRKYIIDQRGRKKEFLFTLVKHGAGQLHREHLSEQCQG